jgi:hypothetical protein
MFVIPSITSANVNTPLKIKQRVFVKPTPRPRVSGKDLSTNGEINHVNAGPAQVGVLDDVRNVCQNHFLALVAFGR